MSAEAEQPQPQPLPPKQYQPPLQLHSQQVAGAGILGEGIQKTRKWRRWDSDEEKQLYDAVQILGTKNWELVAKVLVSFPSECLVSLLALSDCRSSASFCPHDPARWAPAYWSFHFCRLRLAAHEIPYFREMRIREGSLRSLTSLNRPAGDEYGQVGAHAVRAMERAQQYVSQQPQPHVIFFLHYSSCV